MSASIRILDPICDMVVDLANARDQGLAIERPEREYAFCSHGCLVKFAKSPLSYVGKVNAWLDVHSSPEHAHPPMGTDAIPAIDAGMRILPIAITGKKTHDLVQNSTYVVVPGGPHGLDPQKRAGDPLWPSTWTSSRLVGEVISFGHGGR